jgi:hypothetical protein
VILIPRQFEIQWKKVLFPALCITPCGSRVVIVRNDVSCRSTGWKPVVTANGLMHYATYEPIGMVLGMLTLGRRRTTKDSVLWLVGVHLGETTI